MQTDEERKLGNLTAAKKYRESNRSEIRARACKRYRESNKDKTKAYSAARYKANPQMYKERHDAWNKKNPTFKHDHYIANKEKYNASCCERQKKAVRELSDSYVTKRLIRGNTLQRKHITPELIEAKRAELKVRRFIKEQRNG
jgi:hypothetical protein